MPRAANMVWSAKRRNVSYIPLADWPVAVAIAPPKVAARIREHAEPLPAANARAAMATLAGIATIQRQAEAVREERWRLYRTLRKLNMLTPLQSWSNVVLARVERGSAAVIADGLLERGIVVYRPQQSALAGYLRISATVPEATRALKAALIEVAAWPAPKAS